jgi:hypothetical protein
MRIDKAMEEHLLELGFKLSDSQDYGCKIYINTNINPETIVLDDGEMFINGDTNDQINSRQDILNAMKINQ